MSSLTSRVPMGSSPEVGCEAMEEMKDITVVEPMVTVESAVKAKTIEDLKVLADALIG